MGKWSSRIVIIVKSDATRAAMVVSRAKLLTEKGKPSTSMEDIRRMVQVRCRHGGLDGRGRQQPASDRCGSGPNSG